MDRAIGRAYATDRRVFERGHDRLQIVGPQPDIAVADDDDVVTRMRLRDFEILDLAVRAGSLSAIASVTRSLPELLLDLTHERNCGIVEPLDRKQT